MVITVCGVHGSEGSRSVEFSCCAGEARARWSGPELAVGETRSVELACQDVLSSRRTIWAARETTPGLRQLDGVVEITGRVLAMYEEGSVLLGFGDGRLEVEVEEGTDLSLDAWYVVRTTSLTLFDAGF